MKLAIVAENRINKTASLGGTYWYMHLMLETLRGYDITLFVEGVITDNLRKTCQEQNIKIHLMPSRPMRAQGFQLSFLWELFTYNIKLINFDKVIVSGSSDCRMLGLAFISKKSALIFHSQPNKEYKGLFGKLNKFVLKRISVLKKSQIFTVSNSQSQTLAKNGIMANVINNPSLLNLNVKSDPLPNNINLVKKPYLLTIGQMVSYKGIDHWIRLVEEFNLLGIDCNFVWVGYGQDRYKVDSLIKRLKLDNIYIIEQLNDLNDLYSNAVAYFHPSLREAYCLTLCDSAYLKTPFFCFENVGDNADIVQKSSCGLLINEENYIDIIKEFVVKSYAKYRSVNDYDEKFSINEFSNEFICKIVEANND